MVLRIENSQIIIYSMLLIGSMALIYSVFSSSYIFVFIGLGLTFWGVLYIYIRPTRYVKLELLVATSISALTNIERILAEAKASSKGIYLPPTSIQGHMSSLVFVPTRKNQPLPTTVESTLENLRSKNPSGLLISPPGLALSELFEKQLKKTFLQTSLEDLQDKLPKLFEELQITKNLTVEIKDDSITVHARNLILKDLSEETKKLPRTYQAVGSPFSSSLACVFAKATGKPVTIEKEETSPEGNTTIQYCILEKKENADST